MTIAANGDSDLKCCVQYMLSLLRAAAYHRDFWARCSCSGRPACPALVGPPNSPQIGCERCHYGNERDHSQPHDDPPFQHETANSGGAVQQIGTALAHRDGTTLDLLKPLSSLSRL
jgi:hypothetical protein